jgi:hypothetical protein
VIDRFLYYVSRIVLDARRALARARKRPMIGEALESDVEMTIGESILDWAKTVRDPALDFKPTPGFVREMRDER